MGSLEGITGIADILGDLLNIFVGLLKGDLTVLSTEGSLEGIFEGSSDWDLTGSIESVTGSLSNDGAEG
ncbi:Hypothetical protein CGLY_11675 [Corynebacterium glyciniphilum AJ 3170]|uniref:Uncharacterized protein n=1 Tax=Corynebacterium glyciniphilum AJ 3170 TaxID=1404245 RepID=X5EBN1_9CORY|nr:hypothetical protein [Corynebacterium glyciniphilum]AHW64780.1 Hypothetical protein CGLY_11675 [Corynebacterium glyciniphilum AJ 3170]